MGNNHPELAQLRDIHLPEAIGYWPLAPGFYILGVGICALLFGVIFLLTRHIINGRSKRQALRVLETYQQDYLKQPESQLSAARVSELLKRIALVYYPRERVASLQGDDWVEFLTQTAHDLDFKQVRTLLIQCPFQPEQSVDLLPLFNHAKLWIKQRRGRCLN